MTTRDEFIAETVAGLAGNPDTQKQTMWFCLDMLYSDDITALDYGTDAELLLPAGNEPVRLAASPLWYGHRANGAAIHALPVDETQRDWLLHDKRTHGDIIGYMQNITESAQAAEAAQ